MTCEIPSPWNDIGPGGWRKDHGIGHVGNDHPAKVPPAAYGCGDPDDLEKYDARETARERRQEREERFTPYDSSLPSDLYAVRNGSVVCVSTGGRPPPYPWQLERRERIEIAREAVDDGLRGVDVIRAVDLTAFARRFERWAEEGFQITKGTE